MRWPDGLLAGLALVLTVATPARAETVAIVNAKLAPMTGGTAETIEGGTLVIRDGRIVSAGTGAAPAGARTIDAGGRWVTPGIIPALSNLGVSEVFEGVRETDDTRARNAVFSAALDIAVAVNPASIHLPIQRASGVTRAVVTPSPTREIFGGQGAVITLAAGSADPVLKSRVFQVVDLSEDGGQTAGGSRPAAYAIFRNALRDAQDFARNPAAYSGGRERTSILPRRDAEALVPVVSGRQLLLIRVERAQDIRNALKLKNEFPALRLVIVGAAEGWMVAKEIAAARVPVIAYPLKDLPATFDELAATQSNVGRMVAAGVSVALSGLGSGTGEQPRNLPVDAGNLVGLSRVPGAAGLTHAQALAAITRVPAAIFGIDAGELAPGRAGDVVIWSGDPLELATTPVAVLIGGVEQPLRNRQTELRDRYLGLNPDGLTYQYKR
ncbi:MAG: amidohydrolase [Sphingomonadaceae bacterium]|nr:amidohydrolase [Sphingomonadaceae bacterium]